VIGFKKKTGGKLITLQKNVEKNKLCILIKFVY
jgi:hypothetical protein